MVLRDPERIVIARRQERLEVPLDVVARAHLVEHVQDLAGEPLPIRGFGQADVVHPPDLEEVHERMRLPDDLFGRLGVDDRLEADPGEDPGVVESPERGDPIAREGRCPLPLPGEVIVQGRQGARKGVPRWPEEVQVPERPAPPFVSVQIPIP